MDYVHDDTYGFTGAVGRVKRAELKKVKKLMEN